MTLAEALTHHDSGRYTVAGRFHHGEVGATPVRDTGGGRAVAKWLWPAGADALVPLREALALVDRLRDRGAPVPGLLHAGVIGDGVLLLSELLPGESSERVSPVLVDDLLAHNRRQVGLAPTGSGFRDYMVGSLCNGLTGYCEHASLREHDPRTRRLLERVRSAGAALHTAPPAAVVETDVVHRDFHHLNVLQRDGRLSGIVDTEGTCTGDAVFDLVTLGFCLSEAEVPAAAVERVWGAVRSAKPTRAPVTLTAYVAHMALRQVDWSIRHRTAEDVDRWLGRADLALAGVRG